MVKYRLRIFVGRGVGGYPELSRGLWGGIPQQSAEGSGGGSGPPQNHEVGIDGGDPPGRPTIIDLYFFVAKGQVPEGSRSGLLAKCFFGSLGYQGQQTTLFNETTVVLALPPLAARPQNQYFHGEVFFFGLGTPGLQKTTWPINHYGIPLKVRSGL
jgi:hypothetical protein